MVAAGLISGFKMMKKEMKRMLSVFLMLRMENQNLK